MPADERKARKLALLGLHVREDLVLGDVLVADEVDAADLDLGLLVHHEDHHHLVVGLVLELR